jgi:copper chaperone CopZ
MLYTAEVNNVRCSGCANTITKALRDEGFENIEIDLSCEPRKVTVDIKDEASVTQLRAILRKIGYPFFDEEIKFGEFAKLKAKSFVSCTVGKFSTLEDAK